MNHHRDILRKKKVCDLVLSTSPITELTTKMGGQPVWAESPSWPIGKSTGEKMMFIGQICLDADIFPDLPDRTAYLFISESDTGASYDPYAGDSAIVLQPGVHYGGDAVAEPNGPSIKSFEGDEEDLAEREFMVSSQIGFDSHPTFGERPFSDHSPTSEFKIGGHPNFVSTETEVPSCYSELSRLLVQFSILYTPLFFARDGEVLYAFINCEATTGFLYWEASI